MGCRSAESLSSPPGLLQASGVWWRWRHWENKGQCLTFGAAPSLPCLPCVDFPPPPLAQQPPLRSSPGPPEFLPRHHVEGPSGPSPHLTRTTFTRSSGKLQPHPCRAGWRCTVWPLMVPPSPPGSREPGPTLQEWGQCDCSTPLPAAVGGPQPLPWEVRKQSWGYAWSYEHLLRQNGGAPLV